MNDLKLIVNKEAPSTHMLIRKALQQYAENNEGRGAHITQWMQETRKPIWEYNREIDAALAYGIMIKNAGEFIKLFETLHTLKDKGASEMLLTSYARKVTQMMKRW